MKISVNKQVINVLPENFRKICLNLDSRSRLDVRDWKNKFSFLSRTRDQKKVILIPVSRIEKGFSSHTGLNMLYPWQVAMGGTSWQFNQWLNFAWKWFNSIFDSKWNCQDLIEKIFSQEIKNQGSIWQRFFSWDYIGQLNSIKGLNFKRHSMMNILHVTWLMPQFSGKNTIQSNNWNMIFQKNSIWKILKT